MDIMDQLKEIDREKAFYKDQMEKSDNPENRAYWADGIKYAEDRRNKIENSLEYKKQLYKECNHIICDVYSTDDKYYFKCIKCGLDDRVVIDTTLYPAEECKIMWDHLCATTMPPYTPHLFSSLWVEHNYEDVKELYDKMKQENPDLSDEEFLLNCVELFNISPSIIDFYYEEEQKIKNKS